MSHPYRDAPDYRVWRKAVAATAGDTDPVVGFPFRIAREDKVVSAGSCFAQHVTRHLRDAGFNFFVTEDAHPILPAATADAFNYGRFSARYGNIYTARQLLQLIRRAYGRLQPVEDVWVTEGGAFVDPFRPWIQPGGFASEPEYRHDRRQHFAAVRRAFEHMDVFVFTLGLTEAWEHAADGTVFPVCPGTAGGRFDPEVHRFRNQGVDEVAADLRAAIAELRAINPAVRIVLTVSPVPLVATAEDQHVLVATTLSKSILRVAAAMVAATEAEIAYFPSYEIVTGPQARGRYFDDDLRSITEEGVDRVMTLFFRHAAASRGDVPAPVREAADDFLPMARKAVDALCDEDALDRPG